MANGVLGSIGQPPDPVQRGGGGLLAGLFGQSAGQNLTDEQRKALGKSALQSASASLLASSGANAQGFTPGFLQSIGMALGAGQESFAGGAAGVQAQESAERLAAAAEKGPKEQIKALRSVQNQALTFGDTDTVDSIEEIIQGLSPEEAFAITSLGQGVGIKLNKRTGDVSLVGEASDQWTRTTVFDPESGEVRHAFFNKKNPEEFRVTEFIAEPPPGMDGAKMTEIQARALAAVTLADSSLANFGEFFGVPRGGGEVTAEQIRNSPSFGQQFAIDKDPTGIFREQTDVEQQTFALAADQGIEAVGRFLTGAAITGSEESRFRALLPRLGDSTEIVAKKLNDLRTLRNALQRISGQGLVDPRARRQILRAEGLGDIADIAEDVDERVKKENRFLR